MKTTKRALFSSVMALILCFSMLVGTTFAWFTDEVKSANNIITAGNLDVELYYTTDPVVAADPTSTQWEKVDTNTNVFDETLWEPGKTQVVYLKVANEGTLALKYQLGVNVASEKTSIAVVDGKDVELKLSNHIKFGVLAEQKTFANREEAIAAVDASATPLSKAYNSGTLTLASKDAKVVTMVVYMPTSVGNEANHKRGEAAPEINLGINLFATQVEAEEDSFNNKYDEDAWHPEMQVATADDLQDALNNAQPGTTVQVMNDITLTEPLVIPAPTTAPAMRSANNAVVLDLNGKTINAAWEDEAAGKHFYALTNNGNLIITGNGTINARGIFNYGNLVLENGTINAIDGNGGYGVRNYDGATFIMNGGKIATTLEDDHKVNNGGYDATTLRVDAGAYAVINGGTIENICDYTFAIDNAGEVEINGGTVSSVHSTISSHGKLTINGGSFTCNGLEGVTAHALIAWNGSETTINAGTFDGKDNYNGFNVDADEGANVVIKGGNFLPVHSGSLYGKGTITVYGGNFADRPAAERIATGYKAVENADGTYTVLFPQESFDSLIDNAQAGATIEIPAGEYTFPASKLEAGMTLNCAPGTVFEGKTGLNINGATVVGATFTSEGGYLVNQQTINGTFKDCVFTNSDGLRYCYAGETVVFENCVFDTDFYGVHFDGGANDVVFKNCTFSGFNTFGGAVTMLTMEGCTFKYNGNGGYNGINLWGDATLTDCTFVFDGSAAYEWVDLCNDNKTVTFSNCVVTDGKTEKGIETVVGNYGTGNTIIIDGEQRGVASDNDVLADAVANGESNIVLGSGTYTLPAAAQGKTLTFVGNGETIVDISKELNYNLHSATVVFENITINCDPQGAGYNRGFAHAGKIVYNNCEINGTLGLYSECEFNNCTFNVSGDYYNVWTWGAPVATFNGCTFNSDGKAMLLYGTENTKLTLNNCTFNDKGGLSDLKAAVEIGNDYGKSYELIVNNTTVNGYEINDKGINTGSTLWANKNSMGTDKLNVVIDGVDVY